MNDATVLGQFLEKPSAEMLSASDVIHTFIDPSGIEQFLMQEYLQGFVDEGAGKVKFVKGRTGSGKTHLLRHLGANAQQNGYMTVHINALDGRLASIDELYRAVSTSVAWDELLDGCTRAMIHGQMGYPDYDLPVSKFRAWAESSQGRSQTSLMNDVRQATDRFVRDLDIYAAMREPLRASLVRRTGGELGDEPTLLRWLMSEKMTKQERKRLLVSSNIDRKNARAALLSLTTFAHVAGYKGVVILVDNMQVMSQTVRCEGLPYYTRTTRDQAYEMIRELIDESHRAPWLFIVFAGDIEVYENQKTGFCSYPALWYRIQTEIMTAQINRFADIVDLDKLWRNEGLTKLNEVWSERASDIELSGQAAVAQADAWGLDWSGVRRSVAHALASTNGGL